jgi:mono/diheme cytochrome c family protein
MKYRLLSMCGYADWHHTSKQRGNSKPRGRLQLSRVGVLLALLSGSTAGAQAADPSDLAEGGRLFRQKANCQACHGSYAGLV